MHFAEKFQCPNDGDYVYFQITDLQLQNEFDTLLVGSLENGRVTKPKRYGQGFIEQNDGYMGIWNSGQLVIAIITLPRLLIPEAILDQRFKENQDLN